MEEQRYRVKGQQFRNITCSVGPENAERIIIGAHYDACGDQEGADDNASGIAGLLELARLLNNADLRYRVDFVAYTLEEPPFSGAIIWAVICMQNTCMTNTYRLKE